MTAIDDTATWAQRIQTRRAARIQAMTAEDQEIRDAVAAAVPIAQIAAALGTRDRTKIYRILDRDRHDVTPPALSPVVYLRGAGRKDTTWRVVEQAMWLRGWATSHDRTDSWHLARGGAPVVYADFSAVLGAAEVGMVRARCGSGGLGDMEFVLQSRGTAAQRPVDDLSDRLAALVGSALVGNLAEPAPDDRLR